MTSAARPPLTIIIVSFRNTGDILNCLSALEAQTYRNFQVVICENGGEAALAAMEAVVPAALPAGQPISLIADHGNPGYAGGINRCLAHAPDAERFWILNPDTLPHADALALMMARLDTGSADAVGGLVYVPPHTVRSCGGKWHPLLAYSRGLGLGAPLDDCPSQAAVEARLSFISGASILCTRHFIASTGAMREDYFLYGEEVEWCLRATRRGMRLGFCRDALILHHQGSTTGSLESVRTRGRIPVYFDERNRLLTLRDTTPQLLPIAAPAALAILTWRFLAHGAPRQWHYALSGWFAGLTNQRGKPDWLTRPA